MYNTKERSALRYHCEQIGNQELKCSFIQVAVRPKTTPEMLPKKFAELERAIAAEKLTPERCDFMRNSLEVLRAKSLPEIEKMARQDYEAALDGTAAAVIACDTGSFEAYRKFSQRQIEAELKRCVVSLNPFEQTFTSIKEKGERGNVWVTSNPPEGPCGIVQLSRFELVEIYPGAKSLAWNYVARKAVTNPEGELPLLGSCKNLDENEYLYVWNPDDALPSWVDCEQIEFTTF